MVAALGGPADFMEKPEKHLQAAPLVRPVVPERAGIVTAIDTRAIGIAVVALGGGRMRAEDSIDHSRRLHAACRPRRRRSARDAPLALVHARDEAAAAAGRGGAQRAYSARRGGARRRHRPFTSASGPDRRAARGSTPARGCRIKR